jgi:hypothetical protein
VIGCRLDGGVILSQFRNSVCVSTSRAALQLTQPPFNGYQVPFSLDKANELLKPFTHSHDVLPLQTVHSYGVGVKI